ncbi:MAG TPA: FAD-binding oxidoreductase [Gammaproteobacteria bacterium]|nr:FAD-binding oxidoreductase [Gammaproteobacteria bacterium]
MAHKFQLILQEKISLTTNTQHFRFTTNEPAGITYKAGQFISLHIEKDGVEHRRNYSIANSPNNDNVVELAMAYMPQGLASTLLYNLQPGEMLNASGPYGQFVLKDEVPPKRYILIGTGTGVTPYRSMLPQLAHLLKTTPLEVIILQGVRSAEDLLYGGEFIEFAAHHQRAKFYACYSREMPRNPQSYELSGYVQNHLAELQIKFPDDIAYLCGNPNMVDAAFHALQELGLDRAHIRREKYIASKS